MKIRPYQVLSLGVAWLCSSFVFAQPSISPEFRAAIPLGDYLKTHPSPVPPITLRAPDGRILSAVEGANWAFGSDRLSLSLAARPGFNVGEPLVLKHDDLKVSPDGRIIFIAVTGEGDICKLFPTLPQCVGD